MGAGAEGRQPHTGTPLSSSGGRQPPTRHFLSHAVPKQGLPRSLVSPRRDPTQTRAAGKVVSRPPSARPLASGATAWAPR